MKKKWIVVAFAACAIALTSCNVVSEPESIAVESVTLDATTLTLAPGATRKLTATVKPDNADDKTVVWSSSDTAVAMVGNDGTIGAIKTGTATITAKAGDKQATCMVTVKLDLVAVESVTLDATTLTLEPGATRKLTATVKPDNADDKTVVWSSSDISVAMVGNDGTVGAIKTGTAIITAKAGDKQATCTVTVKSDLVAVENITLDTTTLTLAPGATRKLTAAVKPDNADDKTVVWSSSDTAVAMVGNDGTIGAIKTGTATITAKAGDKTETCLVTVSEIAVENPDSPVAVESVMLNTTTLTIEPGKTRTLTATVTPSNAEDKIVTWSSSDEKVATVSDDGTVTAHAEGAATITAKAGGKEATCTVAVKPILIAVKSVSLNMTILTLTSGETGKLTATVTPSDADDSTVAWSSSNADVVTVGNDGTVTAIKAGKATITAQAGDITAECVVSVNPILVESVTLDVTTLTLAPGMTKKLAATVNPDNADDKTVTWSSSNVEVAMVSNDGTVGAIKAGKTTITAQAGDITAKCVVTVHTNHSYSGGKCTLCGARPYMENGTIDENGVLREYEGNETAVIIPDGVTSIGLYAFRNCTNLVSVVIPSSVMGIGYGAFYDCTSLTSVQIPDGVTRIESFAFKGCTSLTNVTIPDGVTSIKDYVFSGCTNLTNMTIPASVTSIEYYAFNEVTNLTKIQFGGTKAQWKAIEGSDCYIHVTYVLCSDGHIGVEEVPSYLKMWGMRVIGYTDGLPADLVIPDGVTGIEMGAFLGCTSLESVTIPSSVGYIDGSLNNGAFMDCTNLKAVTIREGVTDIRFYAFSGCTSLESITIPSSVMYIRGSAFSRSGLTSVVLSKGLKVIDGCAFQSCKNLESVTIPDSVTDIGIGAFNACICLKSVKIPESVTSIGFFAFRGCKALTDVVIPEGVTSIERETFYGCNSLTSVTIPDSVTSIESEAFYGCNSLTSVTIPDSVTTIGDYAFWYCPSLTSVTISNSVMNIDVRAFGGCEKLNSVNYDGTETEWDKISIDAESGLSGKTITGSDGSTWIAE